MKRKTKEKKTSENIVKVGCCRSTTDTSVPNSGDSSVWEKCVNVSPAYSGDHSHAFVYICRFGFSYSLQITVSFLKIQKKKPNIHFHFFVYLALSHRFVRKFVLYSLCWSSVCMRAKLHSFLTPSMVQVFWLWLWLWLRLRLRTEYERWYKAVVLALCDCFYFFFVSHTKVRNAHCTCIILIRVSAKIVITCHG